MSKSIGRPGSKSEYMLFDNDNTVIHQGVWYERDSINGRCYRYQEPGGFHSRLEREGRMARKRISAALYAHLLKECKTKISEAEKVGAA